MTMDLTSREGYKLRNLKSQVTDARIQHRRVTQSLVELENRLKEYVTILAKKENKNGN